MVLKMARLVEKRTHLWKLLRVPVIEHDYYSTKPIRIVLRISCIFLDISGLRGRIVVRFRIPQVVWRSRTSGAKSILVVASPS